LHIGFQLVPNVTLDDLEPHNGCDFAIVSPKVVTANYVEITEARSVMSETESSPSKHTTCSAISVS